MHYRTGRMCDHKHSHETEQTGEKVEKGKEFMNTDAIQEVLFDL